MPVGVVAQIVSRAWTGTYSTVRRAFALSMGPGPEPGERNSQPSVVATVPVADQAGLSAISLGNRVAATDALASIASCQATSRGWPAIRSRPVGAS